MRATFHIVSTRALQNDQLQSIKSDDLEVTHVDFIKKTIRIPDDGQKLSFDQNIVLTSKTTVIAWFEIVERLKLDIGKYRIYCLASGTQSLASQYGWPVAGVAPDASSLADAILEDTAIRSVTFICGNLRRPELPDKLRGNGIRVQEIEAYQTELTPVKVAKPYHSVLFFSPSAIDSFISCNNINSSVCFCLGKTTASHAKQKGFTEVHVADSASVESLLKTVYNYYLKYTAHAEK